MADAIIFGTEQDLCPEGCGHTVGVHGDASGGCSYIGSSGWCDCPWSPERDGVAELLEHVVSAKYVDFPPETPGSGGR